MKIEAKIQDIYVVVKSYESRAMGCYYPEDDYCEIYYARTLGELFTLISKRLIYPEGRTYFSIFKIKALIYNGEVYSKAVSGDYVRPSSFMGEYKDNFLSATSVEREEYNKLVEWTKSSEQYRLVLLEKKMRDEAEKLQKKKEAEKKEALRKKKEYENYLELRKKYKKG